MISKTPSNNLRSGLTQTFLWELRHRFGLTALFYDLRSVTLPLVEVLAMDNVQHTNMENGHVIDTSQWFLGVLRVVFPLYTASLSLLMMPTLPVLTFQYMHQKHSVDLFHSLPVSRSTLLDGRVLSYLVVLLIPLVLNFAPILVVVAVYQVVAPGFTGFSPTSLGWVFLMACASFLSCSFMTVCSGTTFDMMIPIAVVNTTYPLMIFLGCTTAGIIIPGMSMDLDFQSIPYTALSPFIASYLPLVYDSLEADTFPSVAFLVRQLVLSVAIIVSALYLYRSRKSECAESNYAFPIPKTLIRFMATIAAGPTGALIFHSTFGSTISFLVGLFIRPIIVCIIAEAICRRGSKELKKNFAYYGIFSVTFAAFYGVYVISAFGYDIKTPKAEEISYAETCLNNVGNIYSSNGFSIMNEKGNSQIVWAPQTVREAENVEKVTALHAPLVDEIRAKGYSYKVQSSSFYPDVRLAYHMKDGSVLKRYFSSDPISHDNNRYDKVIKAVATTKEYKTSDNALYYLAPELIGFIHLYDSSKEYILILDQEKLRGLVSALRLDIEANNGSFSGNYGYRSSLQLSPTTCAVTPAPGSKLQKPVGDYTGKIHIDAAGIAVSGTSYTKALVEKYGWAKGTSVTATAASGLHTVTTTTTESIIRLTVVN